MKGVPAIVRLNIPDPVAGVVYSLCDDKNAVIEPRLCTGAPMSFDIPVRIDGTKFLGPFVRREGTVRQFVYLSMRGGEWSRRAKIDVHDIPADLIARAAEGAVLEATLPGRAKDGGPSCATVRPLSGWRAV